VILKDSYLPVFTASSLKQKFVVLQLIHSESPAILVCGVFVRALPVLEECDEDDDGG
jgi:hypothetical protein